LLGLAGYQLSAEERRQHALSGTKFSVHVNLAEQPHRHLSDIETILRDSHLPAADIERSMAIFLRLARAEAKVHGTSIDHVHFHEVGAVDSIVDVVGFVVGLRLLGIERIFASPLTLGSGFIESAHGRLPVPVPATLEILSEAGVPTIPSDAQTELVTPTGAAILSELAEFRRPALRVRKVGYGFGSKELPWVNAVRVWLGDVDAGASQETSDTVIELACNLDDMTGEQLGFSMERLLGAGALDVWFTPIQMKKNRPAVKLSVLTRPEQQAEISQMLLSETSTLGVRRQVWQRDTAQREIIEVATPWGNVRLKRKMIDGQIASAAPEYEDCAARAREAGVPLARVYEAALAGGRPGE
jgi:pyridinium-3,5-bisthiocarboxylic acid mononucleotide nickel chelatase